MGVGMVYRFDDMAVTGTVTAVVVPILHVPLVFFLIPCRYRRDVK